MLVPMGFKHPVWFFFRQHRGLYTLLGVIIIVSAIVEIVSVGALFPFMTSLLGEHSSSGGGRILGSIQKLSHSLPIQDKVVASVLVLLGLITVKSMVMIFREYVIAAGSAKVVFGTKQKLFNFLSRAPYQYFLEHSQGEISYRLTTAPQSLGLALLLIPSIFAQLLMILAVLVLLASISWELTIGVIVFGCVVYGLLREIAKRVSYVVGKRRASASTKELGAVMEFIAGIKEILAARASDRWAGLYKQEGEELRQVYVQDSVWQSLPMVVIEWTFFVLISIAVLVFQTIRGESAVQAIPMLAVFVFALNRLVRALSIVGPYKLRLTSKLADVELIYQAIEDSGVSNSETSRCEGVAPGTVEFDGVSFVYPGRTDHALHEINLLIPKCKVTALVGPSGAGKTTVVNLLLRLYDPTRGVIRMEGQDSRRCSPDSWLKYFGYVSQEVFILNGTIADNIQFGLHHEWPHIQAAAQAAHAHEFIVDLPEGYNTTVGDRGMILSGGQRQRIAIARALLRKPEVLIFDEATSALDSLSEALIQQTIAEIAKDHTVIIVAHRLSTVRYADQIVVLDRGKIVEAGTHEELLSQKGRYRLMMASALEL